MSVPAPGPQLQRFAPGGRTAPTPRSGGAGWPIRLLALALVLGGIGYAAWSFVPGVQSGARRYAAGLPLIGPLLAPPRAGGEPRGAGGGQPAPADAGMDLARQVRAEALEEQARLEERARALERRERELQEREGRLEAERKALATRAATWDRLAAIYRAMRPADAANILAQLDEATALQILARLDESQVARILPALAPERAARYTEALTPSAQPAPQAPPSPASPARSGG